MSGASNGKQLTLEESVAKVETQKRHEKELKEWKGECEWVIWYEARGRKMEYPQRPAWMKPDHPDWDHA